MPDIQDDALDDIFRVDCGDGIAVVPPLQEWDFAVKFDGQSLARLLCGDAFEATDDGLIWVRLISNGLWCWCLHRLNGLVKVGLNYDGQKTPGLKHYSTEA